MNDLAVVIFSKDRPLQLDGTLRSLEVNGLAFGTVPTDVLYLASSPAYAASYRVLSNEHPAVRLTRESDFKANLIDLVEGSTYVAFLVDDTLAVGPLSIQQAVDTLDQDERCLGFSFRLGRNTGYCYTVDKPQRLPRFESTNSGALTFDWTEAEYDFGYPLELSSSLYRTADVLPLLRTLNYANPNVLESELAQSAGLFRGTRPWLACYAQSVAFSVPANLVQNTWQNRSGTDPGLTAGALVEAYSRGQRLDIERYQGHVANASHQELEFAFVTRSGVPTVSVVIPCYGQAEFLAAAVESVVSQTFTDWDVTIVDDGSPDNTSTVAETLIGKYPERRIRLLRQPNGGLARARNAGIGSSKGRYVLPLDADDEIAPEMLTATVRLLEADPSTSIAYTDWQRTGESTDRPSMYKFNAFTLPARNQFAYCALFRREVWEAVGGYSPELVHGYEDWDFWIGAVERGYTARRIPEPLFRYRVRRGSMIQGALKHDKELRAQIRARHPRSYRPWSRLLRFGLLALGGFRSKLRQAVDRFDSSPTGPKHP